MKLLFILVTGLSYSDDEDVVGWYTNSIVFLGLIKMIINFKDRLSGSEEI